MNQWKKFVYEVHPYLLVSIGSILLLLQVALAFLFYNYRNWSMLANAGWIILWTAGFFGLMPIITFRRKGNVPKGKSYLHTTTLVDTGIYAIARHPQNGVAWVLINVGLMLVSQHWLVLVVGAVSMVFGYLDLLKEEQRCIEKFGDDYKQYMEKVPRINFLLGIVRYIRRRNA